MTAYWHEPVGAVLDYFGVDDVTLIGLSLGGCLVIRAAAFEPRVSRVIADDAMTDFSACFARPLSGAAKEVISNAGRLPAKAVNQIVDHAIQHSLLAQWGIHNGEHVFGASTPAEMLALVRTYRTDDISHLLTQDILLMAGVGDHLVPFDQVSAQIQTLVNARSVAARIFTRAESAENHCQVGNLGLSLHVITRWINEQIGSTA
jgi:pimeloyl-ACP methyl ester carboxylesterase